MTKISKRRLVFLLSIVLTGMVVATFLFLQRNMLRQGTLSGVVTSKFTDCVGGKKLDVKGNIVPIRDVSCDGGSTITIDKKYTFVTTTGMVASGWYSKDVSNVKVGDRVSVRYVQDSRGNKSLDCDSCGVTKQEPGY